MAQHAILRFEKHKGHPAGPLEAHHERKKEQYASNPDIDTSRSKYNFHIVKPDGRYYHFIQSRIEQARCRTRKDSTRFVDTLITASPEFFKGKSPKEIAAYFQRAADFLIDRVGRENIVSAMVHMDEKTPHLHLVFVPLTKDNRLCAKEIIGNRANLTKWQDDFHACMVEQYPDLERGESASKTGRKHIPTRLFKQAVNLSKQARAIEAVLSGITPLNAGKKKEEALSMLKKWFPQMENFSGQLKKYKVTINDLLAENEKLEVRAKASEKGKMNDTMERAKDASLEVIRQNVVRAMQCWGRKYPRAGYGGNFRCWLKAPNPKPYGSYGNGSAMRVSAAGWLYDTIERTRAVARATADVTHNHREGIKGAEAVASIIYLARNGKSKEEIKEYVRKEFHYRLDRTIDEIRPYYHHVESCQETVPEAITAFMEGTDFEDVIRTAVSLGGDCDTLTDIAAAMAEAFYGIPAILRADVRNRVKPDMLEVLDRFDKLLNRPGDDEMHDSFLDGNERIDQAISRLAVEGTREAMVAVLDTIHNRMLQNGHFLLPTRMKFDVNDFIDISKVKIGDTVTSNEPLAFEFCTVQSPDGKQWMVAFTSKQEYEKGESVNGLISQFIDWILDAALQNDNVEGIVLNPWGQSLTLPKELISMFVEAGSIVKNYENE